MKRLNNFLTSGHRFEENEYILKSKISFLNVVIVLTSMIVVILTVLQYQKKTLIIINSVYIFISFTSLYLMRKKKNFYIVSAYIFIAYSFSTVIFLLLKLPDEYIRFAWLMVLTSFAFFSIGKRGGFIVYGVTIIVVVLFYYFSIAHFNVHSFYVMLSIITLNTLIISQYEQREAIAKNKLFDNNLILEKKVKEETHKLKKQKNAYRRLAYFDPLTSLPNRTFFYEQLKYSLAKVERNRAQLAVLFIDLDNFKEINDLLGHQLGDSVLEVVAAKLKKIIRKSDMLARLGGDEFTLIIKDLHSSADAGVVAQNIRQLITKPFWIQDHELFVTVSIGISIFPDDAKDVDGLIKCADTAMYSAKKHGRNLTHYYKSSMTDDLFERTMLETYIRRGIDNEEFVVHYQPIFRGVKSKISGLEALVRWNHPQKGLVGPDVFIPVAEASSLIIPMGKQILCQVVKDVIEWHSIGIDPTFISVNLSVKQLSHTELLDNIIGCIEQIDFRTNWLEFEITESYTFKNPKRAIERLNKIRDIGIRLSIDDFGTGYSSLSYLKKIPVSKLKIDRSFIVDIPSNNDDETLVRTIVAMGKSLGLDIVAEGVETEEQRIFLKEIGCEFMQGYLFSKPIPADEVVELFSNLKSRR